METINLILEKLKATDRDGYELAVIACYNAIFDIVSKRQEEIYKEVLILEKMVRELRSKIKTMDFDKGI